MQDKAERPLTSVLSKKDVDPNPFKQFDRWFQEAVASVPTLPEAMALATTNGNGDTSIRTVLLKQVDESGFVFYTNYESRKARELAENSSAALAFHWRELERQICITGTVVKTSRQESESYFSTRPRMSQIAVHASKQSEVIQNRQELEDRFARLVSDFEGKEVPVPSYWGGYRLVPSAIEFWQNQRDRLHDRLLYTRQSDGKWLLERLSP
jgi:pyridoxamine 5'-phosphate oxidase